MDGCIAGLMRLSDEARGSIVLYSAYGPQWDQTTLMTVCLFVVWFDSEVVLTEYFPSLTDFFCWKNLKAVRLDSQIRTMRASYCNVK